MLLLSGYGSFKKTGHPVAINGRYILPVLLPFMAIGGLASLELFGKYQKLKVTAIIVICLCFLWGGGVFTFILRSQDSWYWNNQTVRNVNYDVRTNLGPFVPGYNNPIQYLK